MNEFFGRDILSKEPKDTISGPQGPMRRPIRKKNPIMKRLFYQHNITDAPNGLFDMNSFSNENMNTDLGVNMSLVDIVMMY